MPCVGPDCPVTNTTEPSANQPRDQLVIDAKLLLAKDAELTGIAAVYRLLLVAREAHSQALLLAHGDRRLSQKMYDLAAHLSDLAIGQGLRLKN